MQLSKRQVGGETEYRGLKEINSYSSIKMFLDDRMKYYKKFIVGEKVKEPDSDDTRRGNVVDTLLFTPEAFDEKVVISSAVAPSDTTNMGKFVRALYKRTEECVSEDNVVTRDIAELMQDAYNDVKFDASGKEVAFKRDSLEKVIENFVGSDAEIFYKELRSSVGKTVVDRLMMDNCENIVKQFKTDDNTSFYINCETDDRYEVYNQLPIMFTYRDLELKCLLDKAVIDKQDRTLIPLDGKVTWQAHEFQKPYLMNRYYLQGAVYYKGLRLWANENGFKDCTIAPMSFMVGHSSAQLRPLIWCTEQKDLDAALKGFRLNRYKYVGLDQAVDDLKWHIDNGIWNISREHYENKGLINFDFEYGN